MTEPLRNLQAGLRCHDVHAGLRNVDPNSATLAPLADTRMIGMAASLASLIRGQDVVSDAEALKTVVAGEAGEAGRDRARRRRQLPDAAAAARTARHTAGYRAPGTGRAARSIPR